MQVNDVLVDYANKLHQVPSTKWSKVDIVYIIINVQSMHWMLGVVHIKGKYSCMTH